MIKSKNINAKWILISFIIFNVISYLYVLNTGKYNGDFLNQKTRLSDTLLFFNLLLTIIPFLVLYAIYKHYKQFDNKYKVTIQANIFGLFLFLVVVFQIIVTQLYGVGKLGQEYYEAPDFIKLIIQILNRFNVVLGISIYSVVVGKKNKFQYVLWLLVIILSILRTSLSIFVIICFILILLNMDTIWKFIKKQFVLISILIVLAPVIVGVLYNVRKQLRQNKDNIEINIKDDDKNTYSEEIFGKVVGRLSSFTNSAIIQEREGKIKGLTTNFPLLQYPKEAFSAIYGKFINQNDIAYKNLILESYGNHIRTYSSMNGTQGLLLISYYQSNAIFVINLITILLIIIVSFELISLLHYEKIMEVVFLFFCFTVFSGNADEYMGLLMVIVLYLFLFLFLNLFKVRIQT